MQNCLKNIEEKGPNVIVEITEMMQMPLNQTTEIENQKPETTDRRDKQSPGTDQ